MTTEEAVLAALSEQFGDLCDGVTRETNLRSQFDMDSLDCVEVVMWVEDEFTWTLPDDAALEQVETIGDLIDWIEKHKQEVSEP